VLSPFSPRCSYEVRSLPFPQRPPDNLSDQEQKIVSHIVSCGAATTFQIAPLVSKARNRLKKLQRAGIIGLHQLTGEYKLNVYTSDIFPGTDQLLRYLAFSQLCIYMQKHANISATLAAEPLTGIITIEQRPFPVAVVRDDDDMTFLPAVISDQSRLIIVSEKLYPQFQLINIPCRIALDKDLLADSPDLFYLPSGQKESVAS
jgi:hypothetical protein